MSKQKVLFLCTGNSCRSQMAEGWARHLHSDSIEPYSAGTHPKGVDPLAMQVMREAGVDISRQQSMDVNDLLSMPFDLMMTVCDSASQACPSFPGRACLIHHSFDDPPALARQVAGDQDKLEIYRRVRDEI